MQIPEKEIQINTLSILALFCMVSNVTDVMNIAYLRSFIANLNPLSASRRKK